MASENFAEAPARVKRSAFFAGVRHGPFPGKLSKGQVDGMEAILDEWERRGLTDLRWLAYMLATVFHECAQTMQPITETGGIRYLKSKRYYPWYGRGFVQLTWKQNYEAMQKLLKAAGIDCDIVADPEQAKRIDVATFIMFEGMLRGSFTGKKLSNYFNKSMNDPVGARRIINGTDKAAPIAGYHKQFLADLLTAA